MICNWLARGLMCAGETVQRHYGVNLPRGTSCTEVEKQIAEFLANLLDGKFDRALYELLVAVSGVEVNIKEVLWKLGAQTVGVDWSKCPVGFALELPTVIAGYGTSGVLQWFAPFSMLMSHVVIADTDPEEAFHRYGVDVAVTCFVQPRWRIKTVVATCSELPSVVTTLARALGGDPLVSATDIIVVPGHDIRLPRRGHRG